MRRGLQLVRHMDGLSDDAVCARFLDSPYVQLFCGETHFQHALPLPAMPSTSSSPPPATTSASSVPGSSDLLHFWCAPSRDHRNATSAALGAARSALKAHSSRPTIEREGQVGVLRRAACDTAQGWLFGRPTAAAHADARLLEPPRASVAYDRPGQGGG
jgi:hypothetical protein